MKLVGALQSNKKYERKLKRSELFVQASYRVKKE